MSTRHLSKHGFSSVEPLPLNPEIGFSRPRKEASRLKAGMLVLGLVCALVITLMSAGVADAGVPARGASGGDKVRHDQARRMEAASAVLQQTSVASLSRSGAGAMKFLIEVLMLRRGQTSRHRATRSEEAGGSTLAPPTASSETSSRQVAVAAAASGVTRNMEPARERADVVRGRRDGAGERWSNTAVAEDFGDSVMSAAHGLWRSIRYDLPLRAKRHCDRIVTTLLGWAGLGGVAVSFRSSATSGLLPFIQGSQLHRLIVVVGGILLLLLVAGVARGLFEIRRSTRPVHYPVLRHSDSPRSSG